jgi:hypothetical protein
VLAQSNKGHFFQNNNGAWGLLAAEAEILIPPLYDTLFYLNRTSFDSETYEVTRYPSNYILGKSLGKTKWRLFANNGKLLYEADAILPRLMGEVVLVKKRKKWGLIATSGKVVLPVKCTQIDWYEDVLALQNKKGQWHLFDPQNGRLEDSKVFDAVSLLSKPNKKVLLLVTKGERKGVIDQYFSTVISLQYTQLRCAQEKPNYVYYQNPEGQCGYIHLQTRIVEESFTWQYEFF